MKKIQIITILTILGISNISAETYQIILDKKHYNNSISVSNYVAPNSAPTCTLPEVLNNEQTACEIPIPTCTLPEVLNSEQTACEVPIPTCTLPMVLNNENNACINTFDKVGWIDRTDSCQGVRQTSRHPNVFILRANTRYRISSPQIPEGYSWLSSSQYVNYTNGGNTHNYYNKCGHAAYPQMNNGPQHEISFSNSNTRTHAGTYEGNLNVGWNYPSNWLGIAVYKNY